MTERINGNNIEINNIIINQITWHLLFQYTNDVS